MLPKKTKKIRVSISLEKGIIKHLDGVAKQQKGRQSRASVLLKIVKQFFREKLVKQNEIASLYIELIDEAVVLKRDGLACMSNGDQVRARQRFLLAASKELEALSFLKQPSESIISSAVIEIVSLLKEGTGYKQLPTVPPRHKEIDGIIA